MFVSILLNYFIYFVTFPYLASIYLLKNNYQKSHYGRVIYLPYQTTNKCRCHTAIVTLDFK